MPKITPTPKASQVLAEEAADLRARHAWIVEFLALAIGRYREHCRETDAKKASEPFKVVTIDDMLRDPTPAERLDEILSDPTRAALRMEVRAVGWSLWKHGGVDRMHAVSDAVEDHCQGFSNFAGSTLDKWWDGIGRMDDSRGIWVA